jgi:hypothetical protein
MATRGKKSRRPGKARPTDQKPPVSPVAKSNPEKMVVKPDSMTPDTESISLDIPKRITFTVSEELHKKAFLLARRQGTTVKDLLTHFLEGATINEQV